MEKMVLMYHDVYKSDPAESGFRRERDYPYKVQLGRFEHQVEKIVKLCQEKSITLDNIIFTFDDGGSSFLHLIAPVLEEYGLKGHFYISTQYIGTDGFLTKDDIIQLKERGHYVGSHAHSHEHLYKLSAEEVKREWSQSCGILAELLGSRVTEASIPNGDTSRIVLECLETEGVQQVYTSKPTTKTKKHNGLDLLGRYVVMSDTTDDEILSLIGKTSTRRRIFLVWCMKNGVKYVLGDNYVRLKNFIYRSK